MVCTASCAVGFGDVVGRTKRISAGTWAPRMRYRFATGSPPGTSAALGSLAQSGLDNGNVNPSGSAGGRIHVWPGSWVPPEPRPGVRGVEVGPADHVPVGPASRKPQLRGPFLTSPAPVSMESYEGRYSQVSWHVGVSRPLPSKDATPRRNS